MKKEEREKLKNFFNCFGGTYDDLLLWSFRYFVGRMTIHTHAFMDQLIRYYPYMDPKIANLIRKELDEEFDRDDRYRQLATKDVSSYVLGYDCDREGWERVREAFKKPQSSM